MKNWTGLLPGAFAASLALAGPAPAQQPAAPAPTVMPGPAPDYALAQDWLCRPGHMEICTVPLDATAIAPDGSLILKPWKAPAAPPAIDCFYVYPTASYDPASVSDLIPGTGPKEEIDVVRAQLARFATVCRLFAPIYRSRTIAALIGTQPMSDGRMSYGDVLEAWRYYLAHDNQGRGVVLIGHSQGSGILRDLVMNEIDGKPAQKLLVSALLIGNNIGVPPGKDVGGDFRSVPLCRAAGQTGCLVTYNSFRADSPPTPQSYLGGPRTDGLVNACVNPAALSGGEAPLDSYLQTVWRVVGPSSPQQPWTDPPRTIATDYVQVPGLITAQCVVDSHGSYLAVRVRGDPGDSRVDDIKGDVEIAGQRVQQWGLHVIDVDLAIGDLARLVAAQAESWQAR